MPSLRARMIEKGTGMPCGLGTAQWKNLSCAGVELQVQKWMRRAVGAKVSSLWPITRMKTVMGGRCSFFYCEKSARTWSEGR